MEGRGRARLLKIREKVNMKSGAARMVPWSLAVVENVETRAEA